MRPAWGDVDALPGPQASAVEYAEHVQAVAIALDSRAQAGKGRKGAVAMGCAGGSGGPGAAETVHEAVAAGRYAPPRARHPSLDSPCVPRARPSSAPHPPLIRPRRSMVEEQYRKACEYMQEKLLEARAICEAKERVIHDLRAQLGDEAARAEALAHALEAAAVRAGGSGGEGGEGGVPLPEAATPQSSVASDGALFDECERVRARLGGLLPPAGG